MNLNANNNGADQPAQKCCLISTLVVHYLDGAQIAEWVARLSLDRLYIIPLWRGFGLHSPKNKVQLQQDLPLCLNGWWFHRMIPDGLLRIALAFVHLNLALGSSDVPEDRYR